MDEEKLPKAAVLLATYNGERYLREQLDSILNQTWGNLDLYIRDDGSTDDTNIMLEEYVTINKNIKLFPFEKRNLGYPACFYALSDLDIDADYFFFSDQDDVWFPDKVERAIVCLENEERVRPNRILAYYAGYSICNDDLEYIAPSPRREGAFCLSNTLFEACGLEFTMAFNRRARDFLRENKPQHSQTRGIWMSMLFSAFGSVIYDPKPCASYRRHVEAVTSRDQTGIKFWGWRIQHFLKGGFGEYKEILQDFYEVMGDRLSEQERKMLYLFAKKGYIPGVFEKVFYPKRLRRRWVDEVALRLAFLFGFL